MCLNINQFAYASKFTELSLSLSFCFRLPSYLQNVCGILFSCALNVCAPPIPSLGQQGFIGISMCRDTFFNTCLLPRLSCGLANERGGKGWDEERVHLYVAVRKESFHLIYFPFQFFQHLSYVFLLYTAVSSFRLQL